MTKFLPEWLQKLADEYDENNSTFSPNTLDCSPTTCNNVLTVKEHNGRKEMEELTWEEVQKAVKVALIGTKDKWDHTGHDEGVLAALEAIRQAMKEKSISKMMEESKNDTTAWPTV